MAKKVSDIIKELMDKEIEVTLEKKLTIGQDENYKIMNMQGGGTDGKYAYYVMNEYGSTAEVKSKIVKVDLDTWQIVKENGPLYMCHANDVAYDSDNDRLIICHCNVDSHIDSIVDPESLEVTETQRVDTRHYAIAYCAERGQYVVGKSETYDGAVLDKDFKHILSFAGEDGHIKQGMECDGEFIYFFQTGVRYNWIWVYDWNGSFLKKFKVPMVGESENLFIRGDKFIAAFNDFKNKITDIYVMTLSEKR